MSKGLTKILDKYNGNYAETLTEAKVREFLTPIFENITGEQASQIVDENPQAFDEAIQEAAKVLELSILKARRKGYNALRNLSKEHLKFAKESDCIYKTNKMDSEKTTADRLKWLLISNERKAKKKAILAEVGEPIFNPTVEQIRTLPAYQLIVIDNTWWTTIDYRKHLSNQNRIGEMILIDDGDKIIAKRIKNWYKNIITVESLSKRNEQD